jgi:transcriptional regulator with XRE-family HTH domain
VSCPPKRLSIPANLRRRYLAGEFTQAELARHLGVSVNVLRPALVRHGLPTLSPAGRRWGLRAVPRELVEGYERGELSMVNIAKRLGVSRPTVALRLREQGVHIRTPSEVAGLQGRQQGGPRDREICRLRAKGWAVTAIAGRFGMSRGRVLQILKAAAGGQ